MSDRDRRERSVHDQQRDLLFREHPVEVNPASPSTIASLSLPGDETLVARELLQRLAEIGACSAASEGIELMGRFLGAEAGPRSRRR
jgi:hypothetical protein